MFDDQFWQPRVRSYQVAAIAGVLSVAIGWCFGSFLFTAFGCGIVSLSGVKFVRDVIVKRVITGRKAGRARRGDQS